MQSMDTEASPQEWLLEDLDNGLHAMAQPLTVLRGALGALMLRGGLNADYARYLEMSNAQVERLCNLMSGLRNLLDAQSEAVCERMNVWELVAALLKEKGAVLQQSGVRIAAKEPDRPVVALGDPTRTEQALEAALNTAGALASHRDVIQLDVISGDGFVDLMVQNRNTHGKHLSSTDRLSLALAKANIRSQRGFCVYAEDPFCVSIKLHSPELEGGGSQADSCVECVQIIH